MSLLSNCKLELAATDAMTARCNASLAMAIYSLRMSSHSQVGKHLTAWKQTCSLRLNYRKPPCLLVLLLPRTQLKTWSMKKDVWSFPEVYHSVAVSSRTLPQELAASGKTPPSEAQQLDAETWWQTGVPYDRSPGGGTLTLSIFQTHCAMWNTWLIAEWINLYVPHTTLWGLSSCVVSIRDTSSSLGPNQDRVEQVPVLTVSQKRAYLADDTCKSATYDPQTLSGWNALIVPETTTEAAPSSFMHACQPSVMSWTCMLSHLCLFPKCRTVFPGRTTIVQPPLDSRVQWSHVHFVLISLTAQKQEDPKTPKDLEHQTQMRWLRHRQLWNGSLRHRQLLNKCSTGGVTGSGETDVGTGVADVGTIAAEHNILDQRA